MSIVTGPLSEPDLRRAAIDGTRYACSYCGSTQIACAHGRCSVCDAPKPVQPAAVRPHQEHSGGDTAPAVTPPRATQRD